MPKQIIRWNNKKQKQQDVIWESTPTEFRQITKVMKDWKKNLNIFEGREHIKQLADPPEVAKAKKKANEEKDPPAEKV